MPAITGEQYLDRINSLKPNIWIGGKQIKESISLHPAYRGAMQTKASLYDLQLHPDKIERMTYHSPVTNNRIGISFLEPKTKEDLKIRRHMIQEWANKTVGMMGRTPDYLNTAVMTLAAAAPVLKDQDEDFVGNLQTLYETAREKDLSFTHSFINPQVNRSSLYTEASFQPIAAKITKKTAEGIIIKGARLLATQGGMTDEVLIFPTGAKITDEESAFSFSIPTNTPGLKFICRESFHQGDSEFNYPLSSKFNEMDTMLIFDNVLVPWERVFFYHRQDLAHKLFYKSSFTPHVLHQVVTRQVVKTKFLLGLAQLLVTTLSVSEYQHIQEKISEIIIGLETMNSLLEVSESTAILDEWGTMTPNISQLYVAATTFPKLYPRFIDILQLIGAGGMLTLPTEEDFNSNLQSDLLHYLQGSSCDAISRVKLFRLAWDLTMSAFGTRQTHYERFFFGDPVRMASNLYKGYPREESLTMVKNFLHL
ncbi:4-hydroxyphenylacetate 3-monooxygenase, oxygenase component [Metabacillus herbersteinensis]|uniref:4-hydroxyphenylacetate 3-monooxygenase, oxygenase component n=1 Tax=Metabacillus herbersteinensis TaxID=283816 RepID=A0ABV6GBQ7_9BACI